MAVNETEKDNIIKLMNDKQALLNIVDLWLKEFQGRDVLDPRLEQMTLEVLKRVED